MAISGRRGDSLVKDVAAGVIGGLAGALVMTQFERGMTRLTKGAEAAEAQRPEKMAEEELSKQPTVLTAVKLAERASGRKLSRRQKEAAQPVVHLGFGAILGALYGGLSGRVPGLGSITYGTGVWLLADEAALPALGLSEKPTESAALAGVFSIDPTGAPSASAARCRRRRGS